MWEMWLVPRLTKGGRLINTAVISPDGVNPAASPTSVPELPPWTPDRFLFLPVFSDRWAVKVTQVDQVPD